MSHSDITPLGQHPITQKTIVADSSTSSLREEVLFLIHPYKTLDWLEHPFTPGQLIILSFIASGETSLSLQQIFREICNRFTQYAFRAVDACSSKYSTSYHGYPTELVVPGFDDAMAHYDLPLIREVVASAASTEDVDRYDRDQETLVYTLDSNAARIYLSRHLSPELTGHFDFLGLPAEIRTAIYEYAMSYTKLELCQSSGHDLACFVANNRASEDSDIVREDPDHHYLTLPTLNQMLSLARVNKQTYREALPVFFRSNSFWCNSLASLNTFVGMLRKSSPENTQMRTPICASEPDRTQSLRSLGFVLYRDRWNREPDMRMPDTFAELLRVRKLERLTVVVQDGDWLRSEAEILESEPDMYEDEGMIPGIEKLVQLLRKAERYKIDGGFGYLQEYLQGEIDMLDLLDQDASYEEQDDDTEVSEGGQGAGNGTECGFGVIDLQVKKPIWNMS